MFIKSMRFLAMFFIMSAVSGHVHGAARQQEVQQLSEAYDDQAVKQQQIVQEQTEVTEFEWDASADQQADYVPADQEQGVKQEEVNESKLCNFAQPDVLDCLVNRLRNQFCDRHIKNPSILLIGNNTKGQLIPLAIDISKKQPNDADWGIEILDIGDNGTITIKPARKKYDAVIIVPSISQLLSLQFKDLKKLLTYWDTLVKLDGLRFFYQTFHEWMLLNCRKNNECEYFCKYCSKYKYMKKVHLLDNWQRSTTMWPNRDGAISLTHGIFISH